MSLQGPLPYEAVKLSSALDILDGALQDPRQHTSIVGLQMDLQKLTNTIAGPKCYEKKPRWGARENERNESTPTTGEPKSKATPPKKKDGE